MTRPLGRDALSVASLVNGSASNNHQELPKRRALWQIDGGMQCSIIGTCLTDQELHKILRKQDVKLERDARAYELHSYAVHTACKLGPVSRSMSKLLDRKAAGVIRLFEDAADVGAMQALWDKMRDSGRIAEAYWAVMTLTRIPASLRNHVFGEVHMLSHLNGQSAKQLAVKLALAEHRCAELETRLQRSEASKRDALVERDSALAARKPSLHVSLMRTSATDDAPPASGSRLRRRLAKCERALIVARARARHAEDILARSSPESRGGAERKAEADRAIEAAAQADRPVVAAPAPRRILYLGGRAAMVPHLKAAAESRSACLVHHDGGIEHSLHRIEQLVAGCDAVVCPVDCVSHGACRMAKAICRRMNKHFLPISTSSRVGFEQALKRLSTPAEKMGGAT